MSVENYVEEELHLHHCEEENRTNPRISVEYYFS